jgi:hypothetical protein
LTYPAIGSRIPSVLAIRFDMGDKPSSKKTKAVPSPALSV